MPSSVRFWRSECWRWPWRVSTLRKAPMGRQCPRVSVRRNECACRTGEGSWPRTPTFLPSTCPLRRERTARSCDGCWTQSWTRDGARPNNSWRNMIARTKTTCPLNKTWANEPGHTRRIVSVTEEGSCCGEEHFTEVSEDVAGGSAEIRWLVESEYRPGLYPLPRNGGDGFGDNNNHYSYVLNCCGWRE
jgi:hypothetical protein